MTYRICPACGSRFFITRTRTTASAVFEVEGGGGIRPVSGASEVEIGLAIGEHGFHCGACSWRGMLHQLTISDR